jgi:hypothetical protein
MCIINTCPCQSFGGAIAEIKREKKTFWGFALLPGEKGVLSYLSKWLVFCLVD